MRMASSSGETASVAMTGGSKAGMHCAALLLGAFGGAELAMASRVRTFQQLHGAALCYFGLVPIAKAESSC